MARVVQRRTPPYLLIVFVLLFVIATVMAVLFFNKFTTADKNLKDLQATHRKIISPTQSRDATVKDMIKQYDTSRDKTTVIAQLRDQISTLTQHITGAGTSPEDAEARVEATYQAVNPPTRKGLLTHIKDFHSELSVKETEIAALKADVQKGRKDLEDAQAQLTAAQTEFQQSLSDRDAKISALDQKFSEFEKVKGAELGKSREAFDAAVAKLKQDLAASGDLVNTRTRERDVWEQKYKDLLEKLNPDKPKFDKVALRPDGKVRSVVSAQDMVYINIGSNDRVTEGLRLTVYPYTGIPEDGKGKGVIEVLNVDDKVSGARIIQQDKDNPIVPDDLVANLIFDSLRNYKLLVEGNFDLTGEGDSTPAGNKAVRELVRRYGGEVVNELTFETTFVILGDPPTKPKKPEDNDPQDAWDFYQERLKDFNRYDQIKAEAAREDIPVIDSERFLDLIGFVPSKVKPG